MEIVPRPYTGANDGANCLYCCASTITCERIEYEVYLRANETVSGSIDLPNSGNFNLSYSELYISLKLSRGANSVTSAINDALTESCLANYLSSIPDGSYETKVDEDEVTLHISADAGDPTPNIPFLAFLSDRRLFSIIVDAFPGESLGIACNVFSYTSAEGCDDPASCPGVANAVFPMPSATNSQFSLSLGTIDCNPEEYVDLPVTVSSSIAGTNISLFDFAVVISTNAPDGFYAAPEFVDILSGTSPDVMVRYSDISGAYIMKLRYTAQASGPLFGTNIQLGTVRIYRPPILCQGYTISASLVPGRIRMVGGANTGCRAIQTGASNSAQCSVSAMPVCSEDFQFNTTTEDDPDDCHVLTAYATLSWDPADFNGATSLPFQQFRAIIDFNMDNGVTIANAELEGMSCPGSGNDPVTCPGACLQFGGNTVEVCINVGSPITVNNNARIVVTFDAPSGCVQGALVRKMALKRPGASVCQPDVNPPLGFPYCSGETIQGDIATELGCWVQEVQVTLDATSSSACDLYKVTGTTADEFCAPYYFNCICDIGTAGSYIVTPVKNDNPLNGVTTFDLVLISRHILADPPLSSPYKMIAADANHGGSITSFDIVELRKLILGIYTVLPNNTSWRFVQESFVFPDPNNPFQTSFPEIDTAFSLPDTLVDFVGIKIGDLNNSAVTECYSPNNDPSSNNCHAFERPAGVYALAEPRRAALKKGEYYTLPLRAAGETALVALQSAFRFDREALELVGPSMGDLPGLSPDNFNLTEAGGGSFRVSWHAQPDALEEEALRPGQSLFDLTFRVKRDLPEGEQLLRTDEALMPNLGWTKEGAEYAVRTGLSSLREDPMPTDGPSWVRCRPNPSPGAVTFDILALPQHQRGRLTVFDAFGRSIWQRDLSKEAGPAQLSVPEAASWPAGVYCWELRFDKQKAAGTFVRQ